MDKRYISLKRTYSVIGIILMKISNLNFYKFYIHIATKWDNFIEDLFGMGSNNKKNL